MLGRLSKAPQNSGVSLAKMVWPRGIHETHLRLLRYFGSKIALRVPFYIPSPGHEARVDGEG